MMWSRWLPLSLLAVLVSVSVVGSRDASAASCGVERWSVKTGTDPDAGLVNTASSTKSSIAAMGAEPRPSSLPANARIMPTETTVYSITATLTLYKFEADSDYHLVLKDSVGNTMIV